MRSHNIFGISKNIFSLFHLVINFSLGTRMETMYTHIYLYTIHLFLLRLIQYSYDQDVCTSISAYSLFINYAKERESEKGIV